MIVWRRLWVVAALSACYQPSGADSCAIVCGAAGECPDGYACESQRCRAPGAPSCAGGGDAGPDTALADAADIDAPHRDAVIDAMPEDPCPPGYAPFGSSSSQYRLSPNMQTWLGAATACAVDQVGPAYYTHLAVIEDENERMLVATATSTVAKWIGFSDRKEVDVFRWVTDQATPGYPVASTWVGNNGPDGGQGVHMNGVGDFDDLDPEATLRYLCECDPHPNVPANYMP
jgi:hypothetical protein